jgi:hypothetical protein
MSNLNQFFGGSLWGSPLIWVQDVKNKGVGGGHYGTTANQYRVKDINRIVHNSISGASLTNDSTNSSAVGTVGTQGIVNNPSSGTHNALSYVTLPAGTYYCEHMGSLAVGSTGHTWSESQTKLYNVSDGSDIGFLGEDGQSNTTTSGSFLRNMFTLTATKNVDVRVSYDSNGTIVSSLSNLGAYGSGGAVDTVNLSTIFFKVA